MPFSFVNAQITIGGNVYGGGNEGDTGGSTTVTVHEGNFTGSVFGGARMANIAGSAFVNIDGENTLVSSYILINKVFGGNDISGTIGNLKAISGEGASLPSALTKAVANQITNEWNAFVRVSSVKSTTTGEGENQQTTTTHHNVYIGQLYGGGNGDYDYTSNNSPYKDKQKPDLGKTYLEIVGGSIVYAFGGGNNATVTNKSTICVDNPSEVVNSIKDTRITSEGEGELLTDDRILDMGFNPDVSYATSASYQIGSLFGGNNKTEMAIRPKWNLISGKVRNLYSGGNAGNMTYYDETTGYGGILLVVSSSGMEIDNVYGGCRKADVNPRKKAISAEVIDGISFPKDYAARVYITGGDINNVYGGNDISGNVYGGNAVGIHSSINQNVYGGGNGSYAYTDNPLLANSVEYRDYYYPIAEDADGTASVAALNAFRPNAESVSIRVGGTDANHPTVIGGAIYCGGNSATLQNDDPDEDAAAELKIGSFVYADNVFLGNNGENMVSQNILSTYAGNVTIRTGESSQSYDFSRIDLTKTAQMEAYMDGAAMAIRPQLVFDKDATEDAKPEGNRDYTKTYKPYSTYFGSLFVGGNVGSLKLPGKINVNFNDKVVIFEKVVGGCNNANVEAKYDSEDKQLCAAYEGGVLIAPESGDKLELNFRGLKIEPKRWKKNSDDTYYTDSYGNRQLEWNTIKWDQAQGKNVEVEPIAAGTAVPEMNDDGETNTKPEDLARRFIGGNIYGGCFNSGHVHGNVVINIEADIIERETLFDKVAEDDLGEASLYGETQLTTGNYKITERRTGVILGQQGMDVLGNALSIFGGGYGNDSEIWGSTTVNLKRGYAFQLFGGGYGGVIGKSVTSNGTYQFNNKSYKQDDNYSCTVNLRGTKNGVSKQADYSEDMAECEFIYGGGFFGPICGNTVINLGKGRIFNSFAGSCNADILGHTETYIGRQILDNGTPSTDGGFPYIRDIVYGGNDLGGRILGTKDFKNSVRNEVRGMVHSDGVTVASAYIEYTQGRADGIFGGCYGTYDYKNRRYKDYTDANGAAINGFTKPRMDNAFVNFRPINTNELKVNKYNRVLKVYGAGQGYPGDGDRDIMQNRSYVLIDIPDDMLNYRPMEVFGAGAWSGLGMHKTWAETTAENFNRDEVSAIIDLMSGNIAAVYGGSLNEGFTRRTVVNVPEGSTIEMGYNTEGYNEKTKKKYPIPHDGKIFGGGYGEKLSAVCDVYEANVNYHSADAKVAGGLFGGNNNCRRTLYGRVNIDKTLYTGAVIDGVHYTGTIYGAGYGVDSWSQYTEVNLNNGATVYEVYGGGQEGKVTNVATAQKLATELANEDDDMLAIGTGYEEKGFEDPLVVARNGKKYNTNVIINQGATVQNYAYGGGLGTDGLTNSGDVYGTTYIALLGGTVSKDLYAAGTNGAVRNMREDLKTTFTASTTAYIEGGTARNVYGGGWKGAVGYHKPTTKTVPVIDEETNQPVIDEETGLPVTKQVEDVIGGDIKDDIMGETNVIIGKFDGTSLTDGIPAIQRNAYGGGEGGPVYGTANLTIKNGYIGYIYNPSGTDDAETKEFDERYEEKIHDETADDNADGTPNDNLKDSGCAFGGGYIDNSSVDFTQVKMYRGWVRNCLFGGGEIAAIGRGDTKEQGTERTLSKIWKAGETHVYLFDGHVGHHVFGGGRGFDNLSRKGSLYTDGYVFGKTEVDIHGGEVGTDEGVAQGYGNVFGGGDVGFVYSGYMDENGQLVVGIKDGDRYDNEWEGYYYKYKTTGTQGYTPSTKPADDDSGWMKIGNEYLLTEDCKVLVEPWCRVTAESVTIGGTTYNKGDYVPTEKLNTMTAKRSNATGVGADPNWASLDDDGIIIHNAVFAGGNVTAGSDQAYAEAITVFGNATASIHDVYHRDLITIGTGHTGGLYGDGNLTFVDGYRGLNITNYGTDYYNIDMEISYTDYENLPDREQAYYELKYKCIQECTDNAGKSYYPEDQATGRKASTITADELIALFEGVNTSDGKPMVDAAGKPDSRYWVENGVCSRYAGRIMNTIQRADFCGVFGSRMVMQGAQDRVLDYVNFTNYTINRVREVSLNKKVSIADADAGQYHGNYFGIYNIVNHLGALTSDVDFYDAVRTTDNADKTTYGPDSEGQTFAQWKERHKTERKRNNGSSYNQVALASGVYLELTTEKSTGTEVNDKDWGYITGVIELDLINVQTGVGGGFVYAKNVHGKRTVQGYTHLTLTALNEHAVTRRSYIYSNTDSEKEEWETSGNFVHSTQIIIDDCYPQSNRYKGADAVPAHYWYIKGQVYVYDQYISAYTGASNAYSEVVDIPLTITAASHGTMKLVDVRPNKYAYYSSYISGSPTKLGATDEMTINDVVYHLNDPISYWDWYMLSPSERRLFVDETYVTIAECKIGEETYPEGYVMLPEEYTALRDAAPIETIEGEDVHAVYNVQQEKTVSFDFVFRPSNNMSHNTGYMLTYEVNNPKVWNKWYTLESASTNPSDPRTDKIDTDVYNRLTKQEQNAYHNGPTYRPTADGLYGQHEYKVTDIISESIYSTYQSALTAHPSSFTTPQAEFESAYVVTNEVEAINKNGNRQHLYKGAAIVQSDYTTDQWTALSGSVAEAYVCSNTIKLADGKYIYVSTLMTAAEKAKLIQDYPSLATDLTLNVTPAYYCTKKGDYGGNYYETTKNYRGLTAWSSLSDRDRQHFVFNYDALDLLIDPTYGKHADGSQQAEGQKYQYDGFDSYSEENQDKMIYSLTQPVDYTATYDGDTPLEYKDGNDTKTLNKNDEIGRETYESLPNERHHYTSINVDEAGKYYVVNTPFQRGESPYAVGQTITYETYNGLSDENKDKITILEFSESETGNTYYYCRNSYTIGHNGKGQSVTSIKGVNSGTTYTNGNTVPLGIVISSTNYEQLVNDQLNFTIHGVAPREYSTLYVSQNSDIYDLSKKKVITVIYQYDYDESDEQGLHITPISERHVVNIHVEFKSGVPDVENINTPKIVLPGTGISLNAPHVTPGAYQIIGGGWELFEKLSDVESHTNGKEYVPNQDPLYWYQDGFYLAYYAKTYLGKTFSNAVQVSVANYHDLAEVMSNVNKTHHMYIDYPDVKRDPKIYIKTQDGIDQLKDLFDLSILNASSSGVSSDGVVTADGPLKGHSLLNAQVSEAQNLEFFLQTDIDHSSASWTSIAADLEDGKPCFSGILHGDGHHISGLSSSLFGKLCGQVYNLGVSGEFTGAGVAEKGTGYVENCWVKTTGTPTPGAGHYAVFGNPSRTEGGLVQVVNSYYSDDNAYTVPTGNAAQHGVPTSMPDKGFYNGAVTYNLNGFYLNKRYYEGKEETEPEESDRPDLTSGSIYVRGRYADGDFIYAGGTIPEEKDIRQHEETENGVTTVTFIPIWPNDYIFFGQTLNYGYGEESDPAHQDVPSSITSTNRVFRAPAYFGNKTMGVAYFNPYAIFAQTKKENTTMEAYKGMTAIDFSGNNDPTWARGLNGGLFYTPLLDDDGLTGFKNVDLTKNLLAYTSTATAAAAQTSDVVSAVLYDYACQETHNTYRTIDEWDSYANMAKMQGHWVQLTDEGYRAQRDHLLVDKQDFNCPISYKFANGKRMWYQRLPERYINNSTQGWDVVSLPFTAELVTTQQKGEITHFYSGSKTIEGSESKIGHEYWLREYGGGSTSNNTFTATFNYPGLGSSDKTATNTFLWDYYYSHTNQLDANDDTYQTFYETQRDYKNYALLTHGTPYVIGFPGKKFYEFDLSGEWRPANTATPAPDAEAIGKQTITFASVPGITIEVSDDEAEPVDVNNSGYPFVPNYMNKTLTGTYYTMNGDGDKFTPDDAEAVAFRPYFIAGSSSAPASKAVQYIIFDNDDSSFAIGDDDPSEGKVGEGSLLFSVRKRTISVTSSLRREADVRIVNVGGLTIASFTIQPGETIDTNIPVSGVYIVHAANGRYLKKLAIK